MSQSINTVFKHNGAEYEFDIRDADDSERFENAIEKMKSVEKGLSKIGKGSEIIRGQCKMLKDFFDDVLGNGAGAALCTEKDNLSLCYQAYELFLEMVRAQKEDIIKAKNTFLKYSNREQRRAAEKSKKKAATKK